jgi:thiamine-monophosphate kinase
LGQIESAPLLARYRRPQPRLAAGQALAPVVSAMMDVSDGLLIDASRMAQASGLGLEIEPRSGAALRRLRRGMRRHPFSPHRRVGRRRRLRAALCCRLRPRSRRIPITNVGRFHSEPGLNLRFGGAPVDYPGPLGWEHRAKNS